MGSVSSFRLRTDLGVANAAPMIVIADRDAETRETVQGFMSARGYRVEPAADVDTAAGLLRSHKIDVLISELALRGADGIDLLSLARASAPATRRIAIADDLTAREREAALQRGALRVLAKPLSLAELADAVGLARDCEDGLHGWMHRMSLVDVLQMYHHAGQSLAIHVRGDVEGMIALRHGELIHAECLGQVGVPALIELLTVQRGQVETAALDAVARTITGPFDHVLLDGLRALDEGHAVEIADDDWLVEPTPVPGLDREALRHWLAEHAPGAAAWQIGPDPAVAEPIDPSDPSGAAGLPADLATPPAALAWACELAELSDPTWTRVELLAGGCAIAVIRTAGARIAFARLVAGDAMLRRFQLESAQLMRWLTERAGSRP